MRNTSTVERSNTVRMKHILSDPSMVINEVENDQQGIAECRAESCKQMDWLNVPSISVEEGEKMPRSVEANSGRRY